MNKTFWKVIITGQIDKDFDSIPKAKNYLRQFCNGSIFQIDGTYKTLAFYLSNGRIYKA